MIYSYNVLICVRFVTLVYPGQMHQYFETDFENKVRDEGIFSFNFWDFQSRNIIKTSHS